MKLFLLLSTIFAACNKLTRKEIRDLTSEELAKFIGAILQLQNKPNIDTPSIYDNYVRLHSENMPKAHG